MSYTNRRILYFTLHISGTAETDQILYTCRLYQVPAYGGRIALKRGVVRVTWHIFFFGLPVISLDRLKLVGRLYHILAYGWQIGSPLKKRAQCHMTFFNFDTRNHISGTTEATVAKFCTQVEYIKCLAFDDRLLPNRRGQGHMTRFLNLAPIISLELVKFKFRVLTDT